MASGIVWAAAYVVLILLPLLILLMGDRPDPRGFWWDFSMGLGFAGIAMMGAQFALTARFRRATNPFGIDVLYYFHRILAIGAVAIILGHFVILYAGYQDALGDLNPLTARWELTAGRIALLCFLVLIVSSEFRKWLRLEYGLWRYMHVALAVLGFAAAVAHVLGVANYTAATDKRILWLLVTVSWMGLLAWVRIGKPVQQIRHPWRVVENNPERGDAHTLVLEPVGHDGLPLWKPGQFVWLTSRSSPFAVREHPFTIAGAPEDAPRVSLTIKEQGDFTAMVSEVKAGETAYLDGPYGVFSIDRHRKAPGFIFVAGGIGITPIISNLRSMAKRGDRRPATLFYCNPTWDEVVFRDELADLEQLLDLAVVHVLEDPPDNWQGEAGFLTREILARHLPPDRASRPCFLCGPGPMVAAAQEGLTAEGVPDAALHTEMFEFV